MLVRRLSFLLTLAILSISSAVYAIEARLVVTGEQNVNDKWYKTVSDDPPQFSSVDRVVKKQYFSILLLFDGYQLNEEKIANIRYDIKIENPKKKIYYEQKGIDAIHQKIEIPNAVLLSKTNLKVCFEREDQLGAYQISVVVKDENAKSIFETKKTLTLVEFPKETFFKDDDALLEWSANYYANPMPNKAIDAYIYYSKSSLSEDQDGFIPMFSFFLELFDTNPYLVPHLIDQYEAQNEKTRTFFIYLLRHIDFDASVFLNSLEGHDKEVYEKILAEEFPRARDPISSPSHLDIQWSSFLATGKIKPIRNLIGVLEFSKFRGSIDSFEDSPKTEMDKQNALKDAIFQAACWFIETNGAKHPLMGQYCAYLFINGELTKSERLWLGAALSKVYPDRFKIKKEESGFWSVEMVK